jgi:hypothetical protein
MGEKLEMIHKRTVDLCVAELEGGLDVHRWLKLWESDGRKVDEAVAVAFYQQALQDARQALTELAHGRAPVTCRQQQ